MAHVPIDDAEQLFRETNPKTWPEFFKVVQQHKGKANGISDTLIDLMMQMRPKLEHLSFPQSPKDLQDMLNRELAATGHRGTP